MAPSRPPPTPQQRRALQRQAVISALVLVACVPAFAWVVLTRELSFAGSFGLFGGHWMLGVLMPVAVLSLVSVVHAMHRLYGSAEADHDHEDDADDADDAEQPERYDRHDGNAGEFDDAGDIDRPVEAGRERGPTDTTTPGEDERQP